MLTTLKTQSVTKWTWSGTGFVRESPGEKQPAAPNCRQVYKRARYYDTNTGEFISRDPLEYIDGMSQYRAYFATIGIDPLGTHTWAECLAQYEDDIFNCTNDHIMCLRAGNPWFACKMGFHWCEFLADMRYAKCIVESEITQMIAALCIGGVIVYAIVTSLPATATISIATAVVTIIFATNQSCEACEDEDEPSVSPPEVIDPPGGIVIGGPPTGPGGPTTGPGGTNPCGSPPTQPSISDIPAPTQEDWDDYERRRTAWEKCMEKYRNK